MEKSWGFFKYCTKYRSKLLPSNGHSLCLFCLRKAHHVDICPHCACFLNQTRKNRATCLQVALLKLALTLMDATQNSLAPFSCSISHLLLGSDSALKCFSGLVFEFHSPAEKKRKTDRKDKEEKSKKRHHGDSFQERSSSQKKEKHIDIPRVSLVSMLLLLHSSTLQLNCPVTDQPHTHLFRIRPGRL